MTDVETIRKAVEFFEESGDTVIVNCPVSWLRLLLDRLDLRPSIPLGDPVSWSEIIDWPDES